MARPVTLFTGQWADLSLEQLAAKVGEWEFDGLELACWGDHFDVAEALSDSSYIAGRREILERHGLNCWAIGNHLVGPGGVRPDRLASCRRAAAGGVGRRRARGRAPARRRAHEGHGARGRAARRRGRDRVHRLVGVAHALLVPAQRLRRDRARLRGLRRALGRRSSTSSTPRACASRWRSTPPRSPTTSSPRARRWRRSTTARASASTSTRRTSSTSSSTAPAFVTEFADRIYHVHVKDSIRRLDGRSSILGGHLNFGEAGRGWDFVSPGHGDVDFEALFRALEPDRLPGTAVGRMGGLRDGQGLGRA